MALDKALKNLKFDARMTEFNIDNGVISKAELKAHLEQLPDSASNSEKLMIEENGASQSDSTQH